jgi:hypothetical protein
MALNEMPYIKTMPNYPDNFDAKITPIKIK